MRKITSISSNAYEDESKQFVAEKRLPELDALRGFSALAVVIVHLLNYFPTNIYNPSNPLLDISYYRLLINGTTYVLLFFLISGFVLSYPYFSGFKSRSSLWLDVLNRTPRLLIPICIAGIVGFLMQKAAGSLSATELEMFDRVFWIEFWDVSDWSFLSALTFLSGKVLFVYDSESSFNRNLWTMPVEYTMSMAIFLIVAIRNKLYLAAAGLGVAALVLWFFWQGDSYEIMVRSFYGSMFFVGCFLAWQLCRNGSIIEKLCSNSAITYLIVGVLISAIAKLGSTWLVFIIIFQHLSAFIIFLIGIRWIRFRLYKSRKLYSYIGRTSFQLYLIHGSVLYLVFSLFIKNADVFSPLHFFIAATISLILSFLLADILTRIADVYLVGMTKRFLLKMLNRTDA